MAVERRNFDLVGHRSVTEDFDEQENGMRVRGVRRVAVDDYEYTVEIAVDWEAIADKLGRKAFSNDSGKAVEIGGLVTARVTLSRKTGTQKLAQPVTVRHSIER